MAYIIDRANVLKENKIAKCSLLVKGERIDYISDNLNRYNCNKMDISQFLLTPGHVMMDFSLGSSLKPFHQFKQEMIDDFISKGCTTILSICDVKFERELSKALNEARHRLLNCPVDYFLGIRVPLKLTTPSLIRSCKRKGISLVIVEIDEEDNLFRIPWGWIRDAQYSYPVPIVPQWNTKNKSQSKKDRQSSLWQEITEDNHISSLHDCPNEKDPLSLNVLKKIGIYPAKGGIRVGGELDYNLYDLNDVSYSVEQKPLLDYHSHIPKVTMHKGKFLKVDNQILFRPGFGDECRVKIPGHFASSF
ncbi:hypothetical protein PY093_05845 [Cytobacillus sp. S13-E01]|uniref:hypothetical protein n=1 Tax=Cytobacillus sp. S13-E01 TaxID=3031326 RepID=UPI0023D89079|nr:hypothetical protein [Cytobacillus sp. S13-E01]MDF0726236.1 hypothetical protein [Cytobacillus sp. S13-E01]